MSALNFITLSFEFLSAAKSTILANMSRETMAVAKEGWVKMKQQQKHITSGVKKRWFDRY
jgi:hypothetical protein